MKTALRKIPIRQDHSLEIKLLEEPYFDPDWHFHPEYQLFIALEGHGTRFVGDHVSRFQPGDLVFTGPNLPHLWRSDPEYFAEESTLMTKGIVIYFHPDILSEAFLQKAESSLIRKLFERAGRGIRFFGEISEIVVPEMKAMVIGGGFGQVLQLLYLLHQLSLADSHEYLASPGYINTLSSADSARMKVVYDFVMANFSQKISLQEVAEMSSMTPSAFSRYFRRHANKTFSAFLSEIRIGHACKLLIEKDLNISQCCYESGFHTLSNFNRQFKARTGMSPLQYRRTYLS